MESVINMKSMKNGNREKKLTHKIIFQDKLQRNNIFEINNLNAKLLFKIFSKQAKLLWVNQK